MKKIILIVGARPNFIKAFSVYEALKNDFELTLIHTGQHFDAKMSDVFFNQLGFPKPDIHLSLESKSRAGEFDSKLYVENQEYLKDKNIVIQELINEDGNNLGQLGEIRDKLEKEFEKIKPDMVIVFGDVTSTLAAGLAGKKLSIEIAHVESGLRSGDLTMPEEVNRILTDNISTYYFVTEQSGVDNLKNEGIEDNVFLVGNTMIDCLFMFKDKALETKYCEKLGLKYKEYVLITLHRPSNVDNLDKLKEIFDQLEELSKNEKLVYPVHPRTKLNLEKIGYLEKINLNTNIILEEPLGYLEFTCLEANAKYVITDSGGIQEETTALNVPCFTIRENTERPITLIENGGTNKLINNLNEIELKYYKNNIDLWDGVNSLKILNIINNNKKKNILITNLYPGHLEVIESIIIIFINKIICDYKQCIINIELFNYSDINDLSKKPDQFINYMENKYDNVKFIKRNIDYDYIIDNNVIGSRSPAVILKSNYITNLNNFMSENYPKNNNIIINDSKKHFYISHRIEKTFFVNTPNVYYLTPLCNNDKYFIPSILPEINKKYTNKLICAIQGNLWEKSRNFKCLIDLFKMYNNFFIKLIGRGNIPECLEKYSDRIIMCNNLEWNDYHKSFEDVYCILPLIDDTFEHNYFKTSLTSSISYIVGYHLKCFYHENLHKIYNLDHCITYNSNNFIKQFEYIIKSFENKKNLVILMNCHGLSIKHVLTNSYLNLDYNIYHISYVNKINDSIPSFNENEIKLIKSSDVSIIQFIKIDRGIINHKYIIDNLIKKNTKYYICPHYVFSGYLFDDMNFLVQPNIKTTQEINYFKKTYQFDRKKVLDFFHNELEHIKILDKNGDFNLYDFIKLNYKKNKLFENRGHPNYIIFHEIGNQIIKKLNYKCNDTNQSINYTLGDETMIFDNLKQILGLSFDTNIKGNKLFIPYLSKITLKNTIPYKNKSITFVSIFYNNANSFEAILRQIKSFKYYESKFYIKFIIIYNETDKLNENIKNMILLNKPNIIDEIMFLDRNHIYNKYNIQTPKFWKNNYGYFHQEIIKLLVYKFIVTEHYIVIDDTKFFINNTNDDMFFFNNKPLLFIKNEPDKAMHGYYLNSLKLFKCDNIDNINFCSLVPFIFKTDYVGELINFFIIQNNNLSDLFNKIQYYHVTEFTLYHAFLVKNDYVKNYTLYPYYDKNTHLWEIPNNFNFESLKKKYNMIGFKFKIIEYIKDNEKLYKEFLSII